MLKETKVAEATYCYHCGDSCPPSPIIFQEKAFCCDGCRTVYEILNENELCAYYDLEKNPGIKLKTVKPSAHFSWLDSPEVAAKMADYLDERQTHITFHVPQIHCTSCLWLLENLHRLCDGIIETRVNFLRKEVFVRFVNEKLTLRQVVERLASLGYEPDLKLEHLQPKNRTNPYRKFYLQLGLAGFAFGNIMLLSFPGYLGKVGAGEEMFFGLVSLGISIPVLLYSASDYFRTAFQSLKHKQLSIDVPIALGILALWIRSAYEILSHTGPGYLDSLAGLVFFLLIGRWFQNKTYDRLTFDRDYTAYFPIAITRISSEGKEERIPVTQIKEGDKLLIRNEEILPADSVLLSLTAALDYSFVTGESDPVLKKQHDLLYAGGKQTAGAIEVQAIKQVSQSYLTRLWNQEAFNQDENKGMSTLVDKTSKVFTLVVLVVGFLAMAGWLFAGASMGEAINILTAVWIVACPCALALTMPVTLGSAMRVLGRNKFYLKNIGTLERMATINHVVFDKTGTLTDREGAKPQFEGEPLNRQELSWVAAITRQSNHPLSRRLQGIGTSDTELSIITAFREETGKGLEGLVSGHKVAIGAATWADPATVPALEAISGSQVHLVIDGKWRGRFVLPQEYRKGLSTILNTYIYKGVRLSLLSGDHDAEKGRLQAWFGEKAELKFRQSPQDKLAYVHSLQQGGEQVMMVGDGLNDAGALQQSQVGIALSEGENNFTPASDAILDAGAFELLPVFQGFAKSSMKLVKAGFFISALYNLTGMTIAVSGMLTPLFAAVLMPLSSLTTVVFGVTAIKILSWRQKL